MSACISTHGEYSTHEPDDEFVCRLCGELDERSLRAELARLRPTLPSVEDVVRAMHAEVCCPCDPTGCDVLYVPEVRYARAVLALFEKGAEPEWEYGVRWGDEPDDSRPTLCDSREHAESRAAESHGDKIVRRAKKQVLPAGPWEETG